MSLESRSQSPERESPRSLEPLGDIPPSDKFVCTYGGPFAQNLLLDRPQVDRFLAITALDGRVLLQESKVRRPKVVPDGINPDGSVTARRSLTWGEKVEVEDSKRVNPYFQVEPDQAGWVISVNGGLLLDDLMKDGKTSAREATGKFAKRFDYYTRVGLKEALLKDKLTTAKDKYILGRGAVSGMWTVNMVGEVIFFGDDLRQVAQGEAFMLSIIGLSNTFLKRLFLQMESAASTANEHEQVEFFAKFQPFRRNVKNAIEAFGFPVEFDRAILAYSYLDWKKYTGNPLIVSP